MKAKQAGILSAILASTCCIGPLLPVAIGLGSGAALVGRYHWFFLIGGLAVLTRAWAKYLREKTACDCEHKGMEGRRSEIITLLLVTALVLGFVGYYFASFADFLGLQYISAGLGRLILFIYPTLVVLLSMVFLQKRPTASEVVALAVTYSGIALVISNAMGGSNTHLALGAALCFASAAGYAVYLVASSQVVQRVGSMRFTAYATSVASGFCILQFLLLRPMSALALPVQVYGLAIAMALLSTVLPVFITTEALKRIGANQVALFGALGPVTTLFFGWMGLDEVMTPVQLAGAVLVLAGVVLVTLKAAK